MPKTRPSLAHPSLAGALVPVLLAVLVSLPGAGPAAGADLRPCATVAERHLEQLNVARADLEDLSVVTVLANLEFGTVSEIQAWASFKSCPGALVVRMTPFCRVKSAYARGGCRFPDVPHY